jgi:phosphoribosylformylglycinamidine (FGAM) synthase PurS component
MSQISTYSDVYSEMLARVNDPDGDTYTDRAKELVYEGISSLAISGQVEADQMSSLVVAKRIDHKADEEVEDLPWFPSNMQDSWRLKVSGTEHDLGADNLIKVIGITDDHIYHGDTRESEMQGMNHFARDDDGVQFHNQDTQQVKRQKYIPISLSEVNRLNDPEEQPFFDEIYYYRRNDYIYFFPWRNFQNMAFVIHYLKSPPAFIDNDNMIEKFSLDFLYKVIDYGVGRIREEQAGQ